MKHLCLFVLITVLCNQISAQVKIGQQAPEIALSDTAGNVIKLSSLQGKVVLIDFWASWCGPCRASIPSVIKLYNKFKGDSFEILGVSIDSKRSAWIKAILHDHIKYLQVNDPGGWNAISTAAYGVNEIPTTFLIDKTGKIIAIDPELKNLSKLIRRAL